ncbi:MAG: protein disulfide isomerase family protein [Thermoguttaceae bacterium]
MADYEEARNFAKQNSKPVLVVFTVPHNTSTSPIFEALFRDPDVNPLLEKFVCVQVNGVVEQKLCESLKIKGFPTTLLQTPSGTELYRFVGKPSVEEITFQMHIALQSTASKSVVHLRK